MGFIDKFGLILLAVGILAIIGFLRQFGFLKGKNFTYALSAGLMFFGITAFQTWRRSQAKNEFDKRERELKEKEKIVEELTKLVDLSDEEKFKTDAALKSERGAYAIKVANIDAEKEKDVQKAKERNIDMSIDDLTASILGS